MPRLADLTRPSGAGGAGYLVDVELARTVETIPG